MTLTLTNAITMFEGEMRRGMWKQNSRDRYARELRRFAMHVGDGRDIRSITSDDARSYLDTFNNHAESTVALEHTILSSFYMRLVRNEIVPANIMDKIERPKVPNVRDRKRARISAEQVQAMLDEAESWPERLCVFTVAFLGVRRTALAEMRWRDVDAKRWTAAFVEKGGKRIEKPIPHRLRAVYTAYAIERSRLGDPIRPDEWVVPNKIKLKYLDRRSPRIVYVLVTDVAKRLSVKAHCHSFRSAFANQFLSEHPGELEALRHLMGHSSIATTQGYFDEHETARSMRVVVDLDFNNRAA